MTRHYPDLGSASDWSCRLGNLIQPIRSTTQIWVVIWVVFYAPIGLNYRKGVRISLQPERANHVAYSILVHSGAPEGPEVQPRLVCEALWHGKLFCSVWYLELDSDLSRFDYEYEFSSTSESFEFRATFILRIITLSCCQPDRCLYIT